MFQKAQDIKITKFPTPLTIQAHVVVLRSPPWPWKHQTLHSGAAALWPVVAISPAPILIAAPQRLKCQLPSLEAALLLHLASFISKCQLTQIQSS